LKEDPDKKIPDNQFRDPDQHLIISDPEHWFRLSHAEAMWRPLVKRTFPQAALQYRDIETDEEKELGPQDFGEKTFRLFESSDEEETGSQLSGTESGGGSNDNEEASGAESIGEDGGVESFGEANGGEHVEQASAGMEIEDAVGGRNFEVTVGGRDMMGEAIRGAGIGDVIGDENSGEACLGEPFEIKKSNFRKLARNFNGLFNKKGPSISTANSWKEVFMTEDFWKDQVAT